MPTLGPQTQLDRVSPKRADVAWVTQRLADKSTRFMVLVDLKPAVVSNADQTESQIRWYTLDDVLGMKFDTTQALFLGQEHESKKGYFALAVSEAKAKTMPGAAEMLRPYVDLRTLAMQGQLTPEQQSLCGQARSLAQWHETHGFCSKCGSVSDLVDAGWRRKCTNEACKMDHFPRTDPVVIMLVVDGDRCLLGHEKRFGQMYSRKFYSTLAGFLESGEDIEAAVRREVLEEAGIKVGKVHYYRSQPWPFPHSLMMGCIAEAASKEINIDKHEIEDAKWFSREEARAALAGEHPELAVPGKHAIAHHLIKAFVEDSWRNS